MCRSIKTLRGMQPPATHDDVHAAALQFVRKVSGFRQPSATNAAAFDAAVADVTGAAERLLDSLVVGTTRVRREPTAAASPGSAAR